jgi:hypothetical protein
VKAVKAQVRREGAEESSDRAKRQGKPGMKKGYRELEGREHLPFISLVSLTPFLNFSYLSD